MASKRRLFSRQDGLALLCIGLMCLGAFVLPTSAAGFILIGLGGLGLLVLIAWHLMAGRQT